MKKIVITSVITAVFVVVALGYSITHAQGMHLTSVPISNEDGITEPYDIQPALGYRLYQPTANPMYFETSNLEVR